MDDSDEPPLIKEVFLEPRKEESEIAIFNPAICQLNSDLYIYPRVDLGRGRRINKSYIGYVEARFDGGHIVVDPGSRRPLLSSSDPNESYEDPRATVIDGVCYLTYTKVNRKRKTVDTCLAFSSDFRDFQEFGVISSRLTIPRALELVGSRKNAEYPSAWVETYKAKDFKSDATLDLKNFAFFPEKTNRNYALTLRVLPNMLFLLVKDLKELRREDFWEDVFSDLGKHLLMKPLKGHGGWQGNRIGAGPPPIKKGDEWVLVYHGAKLSPKRYCMGAAVLDENLKAVKRTEEPFLVPEEDWSRNGIKNDVVYLTGTAVNEGIHFFGGAADTVSFQVGSYDLEKIVEKCSPV